MRASLLVVILVSALPEASHASGLALIQSKDIAPYETATRAFEKSLGRDVTHFDLSGESEDAVVQEIGRLEPALVVAVGTNALRLASDRLPGVPLVYLMVLEASPAVRGAPASGVTLEIPAQAQIAALVALYPAMHRLGVLYDPAESGPAVERLQRAAASAGVTLVACAVSSTSEAMAAMSHLFAACDAYVVVPDRTTAGDSCFELAVLLSLRHHVPVFAPSRKFVEKGALAALETTYADVGEQAAEIARRMLAGGPAPAPEPPRVLGLCVNEKIARKLNVRIPERYLGHDVEVIP